MGTQRSLRVFISSPADVRPERLIAERVVRRLNREFSYHFDLEAVLWEREPLVASHHFQDKITPPRETDIVVVILWSRLGVPLPPDKFPGPLSGKPVTGTEWEFEDALKANRENNLPDMLLYRKNAVATVHDDERKAIEHFEQKRLVEDFIRSWFFDPETKSFTAAFREFTDAAAFEEMLEIHLRALVRKRLERPDDELVPVGIRWHQSPFRALLSFELEHAPVFFGRTRARNELRELLVRQTERNCSFLLVVGGSGTGKSSLIKAGLLADLTLPGMVGRVALVRHATFRPSDQGGDPLRALAAAMQTATALPELTEMQYDTASLTELLQVAPGQVRLPVRQGLALASKAADLTEMAEARLLLIVDQLEELFTANTISTAERESFVAALDALARSGQVWILATLRSDFSDRLAAVPELLKLAAEGRYDLAPPEPAEIAQIIRQPAREAGVRFEVDSTKGIGLDEVIRKVAGHDPGALPLLSFLLDQLWQARSDGGLLTFAAYDALGGLEGALGRRAEEIYSQLPATIQAALPSLLRALVTVGDDAKGAATSRTIALASFAEGSAQRELLEAFIHPEARLLIVADDATGATVRVAHEALLTHWPRAQNQIAADYGDLQLRARLERAEAIWRDASAEDRDSLLLPTGRPLKEAADFVARSGEGLDEALTAYVRLSVTTAEKAKTRIMRRVLAAGLSFLLLTGLAYTAAADGGMMIPLGRDIRTALDRHDISVFRRVHTDQEIISSINSIGMEIGALFTKKNEKKNFNRYEEDDMSGTEFLDVWTVSQATSAIFSAYTLTSQDVADKFVQMLQQALQGKGTVNNRNEPVGWPSSVFDYPHAATTLWTISAISRLNPTPEGMSELHRQSLKFAVAASSHYYQERDGAWNQFPDQERLDKHSAYSTALALQSLLDLKASGLGWDGDHQELDRRLDKTFSWLKKAYRPADSDHPAGWIPADGEGESINEELTFQIYAVLLRYHQQIRPHKDHDLPDGMVANAIALVRSQGERGLTPIYTSWGFAAKFHFGSERIKIVQSIRFLRFAWAAECAARLVRMGRTEGAILPEDLTALRRVLSHILVDQKDAVLVAVKDEYPWVGAEALQAFAVARSMLE
jgi:hypothetical protein